MIIPPQAIAGARSALEGLLSDTCTITRGTTVRTSTGATKPGTAGVQTGIACRVEVQNQEPDGMVKSDGTENYADSTWIVYMPYDTDVQELDTITVDGSSLPALAVSGTSDRMTDGYLLMAFTKERV